jgi:hypothetical protein
MAPRNTEGQPEAESLIGTKLSAPPSRNDLLSRSEVVELLHAGSDRKLTLLSAPAGYGKTMLLTEWRAAEAGDHLFAWLSLDLQDDEIVRFWTYVIAALRSVAPDVGARSLAALKAGADLTRSSTGPVRSSRELPSSARSRSSVSPVVRVHARQHERLSNSSPMRLRPGRRSSTWRWVTRSTGRASSRRHVLS